MHLSGRERLQECFASDREPSADPEIRPTVTSKQRAACSRRRLHAQDDRKIREEEDFGKGGASKGVAIGAALGVGGAHTLHGRPHGGFGNCALRERRQRLSEQRFYGLLGVPQLVDSHTVLCGNLLPGVAIPAGHGTG